MLFLFFIAYAPRKGHLRPAVNLRRGDPLFDCKDLNALGRAKPMP